MDIKKLSKFQKSEYIARDRNQKTIASDCQCEKVLKVDAYALLCGSTSTVKMKILQDSESL